MKVLMLTDRMETGGAETHIAMLARELAGRGVDVSVLSAGGKTASALERDGIRQFLLPPAGRSLSSILRNRCLTRQLCLREGFDLLHAHARIPALYLPRSRKNRSRIACIYTVHADFRRLPLPRRVFDWGDRTIAVSEDLRAAVCDRFGVPAEAVTVIPNGVDCARFSPPGKDPPVGSVLFASRMDRDCSLTAELLCEISPVLAERFPELRLTLAGGGNALPEIRRRADIANRMHAEQWQNRYGSPAPHPLITLPGRVDDMPELYRSHRVFIGVSRAALEASACGCAVLLCGNEGFGGLLSPSVPEAALSNFCCRGFPPPTAAGLARELSRLLSSDDLLRTTALSASGWIRSAYTSAMMAEETLKVYQTALH